MFSVAKTVSSLVLIVVMLFTSLPPTTYAQVSIPTMTSLVSSLQSLLVKLQGTQKAQVSGATNLVAAYGMNEGSGTTITDASGSGPSGTMVGSPDWSTGRYGNAITFGAGDNVNLGSLPSIQGIQRMTLSAWMKRASQNAAVLVGKEDSSGSNSLSLGYWTDGNLYFGLGGSGNYVGGSFQQNDTSWHHVALVFDGTQTGNANRLKGYVDGQQVTLNYDGTVPAQTTAATNPFGIGSLGGAYTSGQIDEVRVYTRTLSQAEIQSDMNTPLPGGTTTTLPPTNPTPTISLTASPTSITTGQSSTLTWSSTNATSCTSSGGWTGSRATTGTLSVSPTTNTTYTLACTGAGGTATQSVTVSVSAVVTTPPPVSNGTNPFDSLYASNFTLTNLSADAIPNVTKPTSKATGLSIPSYIDPVYNTRAYKVTDASDFPNAGHVRHDYSRRQAFNADNTRFLGVASNGFWLLYDANTFQRLSRGGTNGALRSMAGDAEAFWHPTDPTKLWYTSNAGGLIWYEKNVETDTDSVLVNFTGRLPWSGVTGMWTKAEGVPSADGRYFAFMATSYNSGTQSNVIHGLVTWDRQTDTILGTLPASSFGNAFPDHISMAPSGKYVVPSWAYNRSLGTRAYPLNFSSSIQLHDMSEHSDLAIGPNGEDYYVTADYDSGYIRAVNVETAASFNMMSLYPASGASYANHISGKAYGRPGWVLISTYGDCSNYGNTCPDGTLQPMYRKLILAELKPNGKQLNVGHVRAAANYGGYFGEHQATISRDGSRILWATNFNDGGSPSSYMIGLPSWVYTSSGGTTPPPPATPAISLTASPTSIVTGQSSTLTWSATNATSCTSSGGWTGSRATSGTFLVTPTANTTYTLACTGAGGTATQSVFLTVTAPASTKFSLSDRVQVNSGPLNVRSTANTTGTLLGTQSTAALGTIIGGPTAQGGFNWWQVNYDSGVDGWSVEDYLSDYVVTTPPPPTPDTTAPTAPGTPAVTPLSASSLSLSWAAASDATLVTGYRVERCQGSSCTTFTQIATPTGTTYTDTGLSAATVYRYRVRATDAAGNLSTYSTIGSGTTNSVLDTTAPTVPGTPVITAPSAGTLSLTWAASTDSGAGLARYRVERCQGSTCTTYTEVGTPTTPAFVNTGLTSGTAYRYRVRAEDQAGNLSGYSTPASQTTVTVTPTDTTAPTLSSIQASGSADAATVTGTTNEPARLRVDYGLTATSLTSSVSTTTLTTAHTLTLPSLTRRTTYYYRLTVTDQAGNSTQSTVRSFTTGKGKTAPIKNLNAVYGSVILS